MVRLGDNREVLASWRARMGMMHPDYLQGRRVRISLRTNPARGGVILEVLKDDPAAAP